MRSITVVALSASMIVGSMHVADAERLPLVCGNGKAQRREVCDGSDLRKATCTSLGYDGGVLACSPTCIYDASDCFRGPALSLVWKDALGVVVGAFADDTQTLVRQTGARLTRNRITLEGFLENLGDLYHASTDCTGTPYIHTGEYTPNRILSTQTINDIVYYAADAGEPRTVHSIFTGRSDILSEADCFGATFIPPHGCCAELEQPATYPVTIPSVLDLEGVTFPLQPALQ